MCKLSQILQDIKHGLTFAIYIKTRYTPTQNSFFAKPQSSRRRFLPPLPKSCTMLRYSYRRVFPPDRPTLPIGAANVTQSRESPALKQSVTVRLSRPAVLRALWDGTHILCDTPPAVPAAPLPDSFSCRSTLKVRLCPPAPHIS